MNTIVWLKEYRLRWKNKETGLEGCGEALSTKPTAQAWVNEMNVKYPNIIHWMEWEKT